MWQRREACCHHSVVHLTFDYTVEAKKHLVTSTGTCGHCRNAGRSNQIAQQLIMMFAPTLYLTNWMCSLTSIDEVGARQR